MIPTGQCFDLNTPCNITDFFLRHSEIFLVVQAEKQLLEVLDGFKTTEPDAIIPRSPIVKLVRLPASEIAAVASHTREYPSQRELSSPSTAEVTEPASEPVPPTEKDSSFAAVEVTEPTQKALLRSDRSSSCATISRHPASKPSKLRSPRNEREPNKRDSTHAAPRVTEPVALESFSAKEQNSHYGPIEVTDSTPEPIPPKERNLLDAATVTETATPLKCCRSLNHGKSSWTTAVNEAAPLPEPSPPLSSQKPTSAAQESPEPEPSSVGQNLNQGPCSSRPRKIRKVAKSRKYDYNF